MRRVLIDASVSFGRLLLSVVLTSQTNLMPLNVHPNIRQLSANSFFLIPIVYLSSEMWKRAVSPNQPISPGKWTQYSALPAILSLNCFIVVLQL